MDYVLVLMLIVAYLFSVVGLGIMIDEAHEQGKYSVKEYKAGIRWAFVPGVNTLLLFINLFTWIVYRLSYGRK